MEQLPQLVTAKPALKPRLSDLREHLTPHLGAWGEEGYSTQCTDLQLGVLQILTGFLRISLGSSTLRHMVRLLHGGQGKAQIFPSSQLQLGPPLETPKGKL